MNFCSKCTSRPESRIPEGTLWVTGLSNENASVVTSAIQPYGLWATYTSEEFLAIDLFGGALEIFLASVRLLPSTAVENAQYVVLPSGESLSENHHTKLSPLPRFLKIASNVWLSEMIRDERFCVHFQPIVNVTDPNTVHAHECLMRGISAQGDLVYPGTILNAAEEEDMLFQIDRLARINSIRSFAKQNVPGKAFINFNPMSVYNPLACLATTVAAAKEAGLGPDRIVIELIERDRAADERHLLRIVEFYRSAGYGVALDDVGTGYSNLHLFAALKPDYMKIDMGLIRNIDRDPARQIIVGGLLEMSRRLNIRSVVEGVESTDEYEFVRAEGADFAQGYLFGRPSEAARRNSPNHGCDLL